MPRRTAGRWIVLALVAFGLAPGTWWRTALPQARIDRLGFAPVRPGPIHDWPAGLSVENVWRMTSPDPFFGGYSALLASGDGRLRAFSDKGDSLAFTPPGNGPAAPRFAQIVPDPRLATTFQDIESVTADRANGRYWLGYEQTNAIRRYPRFTGAQNQGTLVRPRQMRDWPDNSGAEAMVRLADGRFLVFGERSDTGLLFDGDPVEGVEASSFAVAWPPGYRPADAAALPDGRILVLMRAVSRASWPPFASMLVIGDPARIARHVPWRPTVFARLAGALPPENYEALAIVPDRTSLTIWLMSDDNFASFQRTLLVRLRWANDEGTPR